MAGLHRRWTLHRSFVAAQTITILKSHFNHSFNIADVLSQDIAMVRHTRDNHEVTPFENTAFFSIETDDGYVRIEQSLGNQVLYTPDEARDIADAIRKAASDAPKEP